MASKRGEELLAAYERDLAELGVRPHWGQINALTAERVRELYPRWETWLATAARFNATGVFDGPFSRRWGSPDPRVAPAARDAFPPAHAVSDPARPSPALERMTAAVAARVRPAIDATAHPSVRPALHVAALVAGAAMLALFAFGTVMMATMLRWWYVAIGVLLLAGVPRLLDRPARDSRAIHVATLTVLTTAVPVVALLGFDVLWSWARLTRPSPAIGLAIAGVVVAAVAYTYLLWVGNPPPPHHRLWSLYATLSALALAALTSGDLPELNLLLPAAAGGLATWVYLGREAGPEIKHPLWWALLLVGVAIVAVPLLVEAIQGGRVSVTLLVAGAVIAAFAGLNGLWLPATSKTLRDARRAFGIALVAIALPLVVVAFALATSTAPDPPHEESLPIAAASALPEGAIAHRPIILFDTDERFRTPLDVDQMLATGDVQLCPEGTGLLADCRTLRGVTDLRNGFGNLRFDTQQIDDAVDQDRIRTTIYVHAVPDQLHRGWTDIDYWWYLADNPADTARGAMCGAGLVIPEITSFDHQSDWEGVTVVLDEDKRPVAVHFAAHNHVINVPWSTLQAALSGKGRLRRYAGHPDVAERPLVFVARGTHAAYPLPCDSSTCEGDTAFEDNRHNGQHEWPEQPCSTDACVTAFPRTPSGGDASWNAYKGQWGSAVCIAKDIYCARSNAPKAPGTQGRYMRPWCYDFETRTSLRERHPAKPRECRKKKQG